MAIEAGGFASMREKGKLYKRSRTGKRLKKLGKLKPNQKDRLFTINRSGKVTAITLKRKTKPKAKTSIRKKRAVSTRRTKRR